MMKPKNVCEKCGKPLPAGKTVFNICPECLLAEEESREAALYDQSMKSPDFSGYDLPDRRDFTDVAEWCIAFAVSVNASDIHFKTGILPHIRKGGTIIPIGNEIMTDEAIYSFIKKKVPYAENEHNRAYDFSFSIGQSRFRGNAFHDSGGWSVALRNLWIQIFDFRKLGIPDILKDFAKNPSGLILVTGPTGSGKTTTLTCLLDFINHRTKKHIITMEDPVEYLYTMDKCIISQREIGKDTDSYERSIVEAMREDPDIIMIGEMRDLASIEAALRAAETGHLVLSTLHTRDSASTINRIIDIFPVDQQQQIRTQLALCLIGSVSQQLIPSTVPGERCLATEVMRVTYPVRALIRENKVHMMSNVIQTSGADGMYTMRKSLENLLRAGKITKETFDEYCTD